MRQAITDAGGDPTVDFCEPAPTVWTAPELPAEVDVVELGAQLAAVGRELGVEVRLRQSEPDVL